MANEQPIKRKRGRPRKNPIPTLPEEIKQIVQETQAKEEQEYKEVIKQVLNEARGEWDVRVTDPIPFFDSELSYELTGYKPITATKGLDFDPKWFTETRETFLRTGHYCQFPPNSKAFRDFWTEQYIRCRDGMTVNGYTITGDNYFFLNYYQLMDLNSAEKAGAGRVYDFPQFFVKQYEYFHYIELCKRLRKNAIGLKARGVGFSEIGASIAVNTYNCRRNSVIVIAAQLENYLSKTLSKCWKQLDFLNAYTDGGFAKLRQVKDTEFTKRASAYKIDSSGRKVESGWMSEINGINADKPNKIRGDRTDLLIYEESGSWPKWKKAFEQGDALVGIQGAKFGIKMAWGTGGDSGPALEGLADAYYKPSVYDALPYRHHYTPSGEELISCYFIPSYCIINDPARPDLLDKRGWTDPVKGREYYERKRDEKANDPESLIIHCAEYCFNADEALALEGTNKFNKVLIAEQIAAIRKLKVGAPIQHGLLEYQFRNGQHTKENITGFRWIDNPNGKVHILEHPLWTLNKTDENGNPIVVDKMRNLYVAGIDSIDIGKRDTSEATKDPSDFCIVIKKRAYGNGEPQYVAYYKDRPNDVRECFKIAVRLMQYYNCMGNIEASRMSFISWARDNGYINLFMKRPRATMPDVLRGQSKQYGSPATPAVIDHQTDLIADFVNDYCHTIWFPEMLDELNRYTDENKGKFDIVAAMGQCELGDEEIRGIVPKEVERVEDQFEDIGYYIDDKGYKRYGIIPKQKQWNMNPDIRPISDYSNMRTSDPRRR